MAGPPPPNIAAAEAAAPAVATTLRLDDLQGEAGATVQTHLRAASLQAVAGGSFALVYDPAAVTEVVTVTRGSLAAGLGELAFHDDGAGILTIALAGTAEINGDGELLTIELRLALDAPVGSLPLRLADAKLNNLNGRDFVTGSAANTITRQSAQLTVLPGAPVEDGLKLYLPAIVR